MTAPPRLALAGGRRHATACLARLLELGVPVVAVFTYPPDPSEVATAEPVEDLARRRGIPCVLGHDLRRPEARALLEASRPDALLAVKWRRIFHPETRAIVKPFVIHDSLLPELRGAAPLNWAILLGERETGATLFLATEDLDAGPIAAQERVPIGPDDTAQDVEDRLVPLYADLAGRLGTGLGALALTPQDESRATYGTWRVPEDGLVDWARPARAIHDLARALAPPWPGARTTLDGRPVVLARTRVAADEDRWIGRVPGRVVERRSDGVLVLAGQGTLLVRELVAAGKTVPARDLVTSLRSTFGR